MKYLIYRRLNIKDFVQIVTNKLTHILNALMATNSTKFRHYQIYAQKYDPCTAIKSIIRHFVSGCSVTTRIYTTHLSNVIKPMFSIMACCQAGTNPSMERGVVNNNNKETIQLASGIPYQINLSLTQLHLRDNNDKLTHHNNGVIQRWLGIVYRGLGGGGGGGGQGGGWRAGGWLGLGGGGGGLTESSTKHLRRWQSVFSVYTLTWGSSHYIVPEYVSCL